MTQPRPTIRLWCGLFLGLTGVHCLGNDDRVLVPDSTEETQEPQEATAASASEDAGDAAGTASAAPDDMDDMKAAANDGSGNESMDGMSGSPQDAPKPTQNQPGEDAESAAAGGPAADPATTDGTTTPDDGAPPAMPGDMATSAMDSPTEGNAATAQDADCDMSGLWMVAQITVSEALGLPQSSTAWHFFELSQTGTTVEVSDHYDCGIQVVGTAQVNLSRAALEAQMEYNGQKGRKGTMRKEGDSCVFEFEPFWSVRGAEAERFLPGGIRNSTESIAAVSAMLPLPTPDHLDGAIDPDGDGILGLAFEVSGLISGTRNAVQRDWNRWFTAPGFEITPNVNWDEGLVVRADFDNDEQVLDPPSGFLASSAAPKTNAEHEVRLRFLGRDASDPRAVAMMQGTKVETCYAIQDALPAEAIE